MGRKNYHAVFANFAQFIYDDSNPENPLGRRGRVTAGAGGLTGQTGDLIPNTDAFLLHMSNIISLRFYHGYSYYSNDDNWIASIVMKELHDGSDYFVELE